MSPIGTRARPRGVCDRVGARGVPRRGCGASAAPASPI